MLEGENSFMYIYHTQLSRSRASVCCQANYRAQHSSSGRYNGTAECINRNRALDKGGNAAPVSTARQSIPALSHRHARQMDSYLVE